MQTLLQNPQLVTCRSGLVYTLAYLMIFTLVVFPAAAQPWNVAFEVGVENLNDRGYSIAGTFDGGAIAIGPAFQPSSEGRISLVRFDPHGNTVWTRTYTAWAYDHGFELNDFSIIVTSNQQYVWTTSVNYPSSPNRDVIVGSTDQLGNPIWTTVFGATHLNDFGSSVVEVSDGFVVTGTSCDQVQTDSCDVLLFKLNSIGSVMWGFRYDSQFKDVGRSVRVDASGDLVIAGETICAPNAQICTAGLLFKTSSGGVVQWAGHYGQDIQSGFLGVEIGANGDYYACGYSDAQSGPRIGYMARVEQSGGALVNANTYDYHNQLTAFWHIAPSWTNGNFVLTGEAFDSSLTTPTLQTIAMEIDPGLGDPLWARIYGNGGDFDRGRCITQAPRHASPPTNSDGGYWMIGYRDRIPAQQMLIMRTDSLSGATSCSECITFNLDTNTDAMQVELVRNLYTTSGPLALEHDIQWQDSVVCAGSFSVPDTCARENPCPDDCYWTLEGNAGTNPVDNYLGTSDNAQLSIRTNGLERMHVTAGGNVGIGTTASLRRLHVHTDPSAPQLRLSDQFSAFEMWGGIDFRIIEGASGLTRLFVQGTTGNVGVNENFPLNRLDVGGNSVIGSTFAGTVAAPASSLLVQNELGVGFAANPGTYRAYFNGVIWGTGGVFTSDQRWKRNINTIDDALAKVLQLRGVGYDYKHETYPGLRFPQGRRLGFIAQELEQVIPEVVTTNNDGYKGVAYHELTALLVESTKQQQLLIQDLQSSNAELNDALQQALTQIGELRRLIAKDPTTDIDRDEKDYGFRPGIRNSARLGANDPNPFSESTEIAFYLPPAAQRAELVVYRVSSGAEAGRFDLQQRGAGSVRIDARNYESGAYMYVLMVDDRPADKGEMIIVK